MEPKTTTIQHPEHGQVEGVTFKKIELSDPKAWTAFHGDRFVEGWISQGQGCFYLKNGGWSEVPSKRDVTGEVEIKDNDRGCTAFLLDGRDTDLSPNFTFTKAQAVVLPEGMSWEEWLRKYYMLSQFSLKELLSTHTTTVIQVWQDGV